MQKGSARLPFCIGTGDKLAELALREAQSRGKTRSVFSAQVRKDLAQQVGGKAAVCRPQAPVWVLFWYGRQVREDAPNFCARSAQNVLGAHRRCAFCRVQVRRLAELALREARSREKALAFSCIGNIILLFWVK